MSKEGYLNDLSKNSPNPRNVCCGTDSIQIEIAQFSKAKTNISQGKSQKLKLMCCNFLRTEYNS